MRERFRDVSPEDAEILPILSGLFTEYAARYGDYFSRTAEVEQTAWYLAPQGLFIVLERDGRIVATGAYKPFDADTAEIKRIWTDKSLRQQGLAWFRYRLTPAGEAHRHAFGPGDDPQPLIERGWVVAQPIIYEDFLPVSAAGIFQSNLGNEIQARSHGNASRDAFETALGCPVLDEFTLYQQAEERSKRRCGLL